MKKLLIVLGLVAMFSLAASAKTPKPITYNFQFLTVNGDPYCDGMFLKNYGNPQTLVDGYHFDVLCLVELGSFLTNGKTDTTSIGVNGFLGTVASGYQYGGGSGPVLFVGDLASVFPCELALPAPNPIHSTDSVLTSCPEPTNVAALTPSTYLINPTTNTWTLWVSGGGAGEFVANYGTFSPVIGPQLKDAKPSQASPTQLPRASSER
jgi:hypothetical protein